MKIREDNEFINKKVSSMIEMNSDPKLVEDLMSLAELVNKYIEYVVKKTEQSSLDED